MPIQVCNALKTGFYSFDVGMNAERKVLFIFNEQILLILT